MKILFDTNTPAGLGRALHQQQVSLAPRLGWERLRNGLLLDAAERAGFDVLLTCDQNYKYQQNMWGRKLAVVILSTNHWPTLKPFAGRIATAVEFARKGAITRVDLTQL